jgi:hypothetical protein
MISSRQSFLLIAVAVLTLAGPGVAHADIVNGVLTDSPAPVRPPDGPPIPRGDREFFINFDDVAAPCGFIETNPLRDAYAAFGVTFSGPAALDGGAILNECGNFGVSGYSSPNFLAFNCQVYMANGGLAQGPETLDFSEPMGYVSILAAAGTYAGSPATMVAYEAAGAIIDSETITLTANAQLLTVAGCGIVAVVISGPCVFILDDLAFDVEGVSPTLNTTWGAIKALCR